MKLISNWKQALKLWSVQCALAMAAINIAMASLSALQEQMSTPVFAIVNAVLAAALTVLRVLSQAKPAGS